MHLLKSNVDLLAPFFAELFLPRDAYAQRKLCRGKMFVRPSVTRRYRANKDACLLALNGYTYSQSFFSTIG